MEQKYFMKFGDKMIPLRDESDLYVISAGGFPIITVGEISYVVCDALLVDSE